MSSVEQLIQDSRLWRGKHYRDDHSQQTGNSISSGITQLDQQLHWRGWPLHSSSELLCEHWGIGELSLLMPLLKKVSRKGRIAWINPPFIPYSPALLSQGITPEKCLLMVGRRASTGVFCLCHCDDLVYSTSWQHHSLSTPAGCSRERSMPTFSFSPLVVKTAIFACSPADTTIIVSVAVSG